MLLVHGTTAKGLKAIMNRQGKEGLAAPWDVSDRDGMSYFYNVNKAMEWHDEEEYAKAECIVRCLEQAQLQQAMMAEGGKIYALVVDIPEEFQDRVEDDYSCPNASNEASCFPEDNFDPSWIVEVYEAEVSVWAIPFIVAGVSGNSMFQSHQLPDKLVAIAKSVAQSSDIDTYEAFEIDHSQLPLSILEHFKDNA
ncbi:hypothetical protein [Pseudomonas phage vB_PaeM_PS3]|uniref:Uncharacterized protein n=2 Tax=Pakpunavirus TaxID=1921407 RepID=A0AAF0IN05_9CAUD|nr:hypothetical protein QE322_gp157 [Pseudomonas phage PaGz-1]YP_010762190.1 hypothetical protein QE323_gp112 [Pseudomonas phage SPA05]QAX98214.1 hypothetical protein [Pseudomonas phage PaGz-1]WEY17851.1 hypothetical protein OJIADAOI_00080 [Pseudomonas phage SPA05]